MEFFDTYWYLLPIGIFSAVFYIIYLSLCDNLIVYIKDSFRQASVVEEVMLWLSELKGGNHDVKEE